MIKELWYLLRLNASWFHTILRVLFVTSVTFLTSIVFLLGFFFIVIGYRDWVNKGSRNQNPLLRNFFYLLSFPFLLCDGIGNYTLFAVLFEEWSIPRKGLRPLQGHMITDRLKYHKTHPEDERRHLLALWVCQYLVEQVDPGHCE